MRTEIIATLALLVAVTVSAYLHSRYVAVINNLVAHPYQTLLDILRLMAGHYELYPTHLHVSHVQQW